jgi:hypothetical protein
VRCELEVDRLLLQRAIGGRHDARAGAGALCLLKGGHLALDVRQREQSEPSSDSGRVDSEFSGQHCDDQGDARDEQRYANRCRNPFDGPPAFLLECVSVRRHHDSRK